MASCLQASYAMAAPPVAEMVSADDVEWGYLNPLRGDASPAAADLWGDRTKDGHTGMLVRFHAGFSSPPHISWVTGSLILPLRHPIHVAKSLASLNALSGGRVVAGVASGDRPVEFHAFGVDREQREQLFRFHFATL